MKSSKNIINEKSIINDVICIGKKVNGEKCTCKAKENGYCGRHNPNKIQNTENICIGKKVNGENCTCKAKENGYCGRHDPNKVVSPNSPSSSKSSSNKTKKQEKYTCNAIIAKTNTPCIQQGTVKPLDSKFHYCKRHSEKWNEFEKSII